MKTVAQVAAALNITPGAVRDAIARHKIEAVRIGGGGQRAGMLLIAPGQIDRYRDRFLGKRGKYGREDTATVEPVAMLRDMEGH